MSCQHANLAWDRDSSIYCRACSRTLFERSDLEARPDPCGPSIDPHSMTADEISAILRGRAA